MYGIKDDGQNTCDDILLYLYMYYYYYYRCARRDRIIRPAAYRGFRSIFFLIFRLYSLVLPRVRFRQQRISKRHLSLRSDNRVPEVYARRPYRRGSAGGTPRARFMDSVTTPEFVCLLRYLLWLCVSRSVCRRR